LQPTRSGAWDLNGAPHARDAGRARAGAVRKDDPSVPDRALDRYAGAPPDRGRDPIPPPGDRVGIATAGFRRKVPLGKE
jgi:hypothetical protein